MSVYVMAETDRQERESAEVIETQNNFFRCIRLVQLDELG